MARKEARITTSVWRNPSITGLPLAAQGLYWMLLAQPDVSMCGVLPYLPSRWRALCGSDDLDQVLATLESSGAVMVDRGTSEVLIRTFVRHDGVLRGPKTRQAMWKAWDGVLSDRIRTTVLDQVSKHVDEAVAEGWVTRSEVDTARQNGAPDTPPGTPSDCGKPDADTPSDTPPDRAGTSDLQPTTTNQEEGARGSDTWDALSRLTDADVWANLTASRPQLLAALADVEAAGWPPDRAARALLARLDTAESPAAVVLTRARTLAGQSPPPVAADVSGCGHCRGSGVWLTEDGTEAVRCVHPDLDDRRTA